MTVRSVEKRKNLRILVIGDVTSPDGVRHLSENLWRIRREEKIDFTVVNGENAGFVTGISAELADELLKGGADAITGGNHTLQNKAAYTALEERRELLRPINFGEAAVGHGYAILDASGYRVLVINAMGNIHIEPTLDNPYKYIDGVLSECEGKYDFSVLDIHAEATGEKLAIAYAYDGKINVIFGTHTHVQTADEKILPNGTGYITDVGMCGESEGIIGMDPESVILRMKTRMPLKFKAAAGRVVANGVIFTLDAKSRRVSDVRSISF